MTPKPPSPSHFWSRQFPTWLIAGLIVLNLVVGVVGYRFLHTVETNYAQLLSKGIPFLNAMQTATWQGAHLYAAASALTDPADNQDSTQLATAIADARATDDRLFQIVKRDELVPAELLAGYEDVLRERTQWRGRLDELLLLLQRGDAPGAHRYLRKEVDPAFASYEGKLDVFCNRYMGSSSASRRRSRLRTTTGKTLFSDWARCRPLPSPR